MNVTNLLGLPDSLVRAITNDSYNRGDCDYSVTQLLKPARAVALERLHADELVEDASTRIWSLLGQSVHVIVERAARAGIDLVEKRFFSKFLGKTVSGQIDLLERDTKTLSDFKVTKAYPFTVRGGAGTKFDWTFQLNAQLELMRRNNEDAEKLQIVGILKDFDARCMDPSNRLKFMPGYPKHEVVVSPVEVWKRVQTQVAIEERVLMHEQAKVKLPLCTVEETWGGRRCKSYCGAMPFCSQYQDALKTGRLTND